MPCIKTFYKQNIFYIMKLDMILVFTIVVGIVAVPYALLILFGGGSTKKVASKIKEAASKEHLTLNQTEKWAGREIAVDTVKNILLFAQHIEDNVRLEKIDMNLISRVVIQEYVATRKVDGKKQRVLEKLDLQLIFAGNTPDVTLNFYDSLIDASQNFELNRANNWKALVERQIIRTTGAKAA